MEFVGKNNYASKLWRIFFKMKNRLFIFCTFIFLISACTSNQDITSQKESSYSGDNIAKSDTTPDTDKKSSKIGNDVISMSKPVSITLKVEKTEDGRAKVIGFTNLPNSSNLLISMSNPSLGKGYQDKVLVNEGNFSSVLGEKEGLSNGKYNITVTFSPLAQSENIKKVIGERGENLTGANVSISELLNIKIAEAETNFVVGNSQDIASTEEEFKNRALLIHNQLRNLVVESREMNSLRQQTDIESLAECGRRMRKLQSEADELVKEAEALPEKFLALRVAAVEMTIGVTCHETMALEATNRADDKLMFAYKILK
jgi:hypothetical protein